MKSRKNRILSGLLAGVLAAGLFAGCAKDGNETGGGGGKDAAKDTIVIATMSETPSVNFTDHTATAGMYMNILTYSTLFRVNMELKPEPLLVDTYKNVDDTHWEFKLKTGVKFHNGSELTAEDVKASLEWSKTFPETQLYNDDIAQVEVVDDHTIVITTDGPDAVLLDNLCSHGNSIVPKALIDQGHDFGKEPIGTGPYKLVKWTRGDSLEFEAFDEYFGGAPAIKHMIWKVIPEGSARTIALEAGEVDFVVEVETMDFDRLNNAEGIKVLQYDSTDLNWLMLNNEKPGLDNRELRHAINCAINKENVVTVAQNGFAKPAIGQAQFNLAGYTDENADVYDPEKAKEWLAQSGIDPATVEMSIICSNDTKKRAGEVIQSNLQEVLGINATIESMDLATYLSVTAEGNYTASVGGYTSNTLVDYMVGVFSSKSINASNKTRTSVPELDALIEKAESTIDEAERTKILEQCTALLNDLCPQAPLYQLIGLRAFNDDLKGVEVSPSGLIYFEKLSW